VVSLSPSASANFYTFFIECFDFHIMFFDTVCCYTSCLSVVFSNTHNYIISGELGGRAVSALGVRSRKLSTGLNGQSWDG
jgi:hypothetical protein